MHPSVRLALTAPPQPSPLQEEGWGGGFPVQGYGVHTSPPNEYLPGLIPPTPLISPTPSRGTKGGNYRKSPFLRGIEGDLKPFAVVGMFCVYTVALQGGIEGG